MSNKLYRAMRSDEFTNDNPILDAGETGYEIDTKKAKLGNGVDTYAVLTYVGTGGGGAVTSVAGRIGVVVLAKADVGLSLVDNTADTTKPVSSAQQTAINLKQDAASAATLTGVQTLTNKTITLPLGIVKADVGLSLVDNTADTTKPVSSAQQTALNAKQATLTAGTNVTIVGNTINSSGATTSGALASGRSITASTTAGLADGNTRVIASHATVAIALTIPNDATIAWPADTTLTLYQDLAATASFVAGAGVTLRAATGVATTSVQYGLISVLKVGANEWAAI